MRKEKLFALALAGVLAVGSTPAVTFAAADTNAGIENETEDGADGAESGEEETAEEEEPDSEVSDASEEETKAAEEESSQEPETSGEGATVTPEAEGEAVNQPAPVAPSSNEDNKAATVPVVKTAAELKNEIKKLESAPNKTGEIQVNADFALDDTITIPAGVTVTLAATRPDVAKTITISRADGFKKTMFEVKGTLNLGGSTAENKDLETDLTINGALKEGEAEGSILDVSGTLNMNGGVTLTGNKTTEKVKGGAVHNTGSLYIKGGSISGNASDKGGAVYSEANVMVSGTVKIQDNYKRDLKTKNNIEIRTGNLLYLKGSLKNSVIRFHMDSDVAAGTRVVKADKAKQLQNAVEKQWIQYEGRTDITLGTDGMIKRAPVIADVNDYTVKNKKEAYKPGESVQYEIIGAGYDNNSPGEGDVRWKPYSYTISDEKVWSDGQYIIKGIRVPKDTDFGDNDYIITNVKITFIKEIYGENGWTTGTSEIKKSVEDPIKIVKGNTTPTPTIEGAVTYEASKNKIDLEKKKVPKNDPIVFEAIGAGMDDEKLIEGRNRWKPVEWGVEEVGDPQKFKDDKYTKRVSTNTSGFKVNEDYTLYVVFQEEKYTNGEWTEVSGSTDTETATVSIGSPTATKKPTATPRGGKGSNTDKTKKASNTKTGDESPILPLTVLCMASLATGGYVLVRRRKKSDNQ